jgi:ligand-binding sensor domain-containing protein
MKSFVYVCALLLASVSFAESTAIVDKPFVQEYHEPYPLSGAANDVKSIAVDASDRVWIATKAGVRYLDGAEWKACAGIAEGPAFDLEVSGDTVWVGAWDGAYSIQGIQATKVAGIDVPISAVDADGHAVIALGPDGSWLRRDGNWTTIDFNWSKNIRDVTIAGDGTLWVATWMGLYSVNKNGLRRYFEAEDVISGAVYDVGIAPDGRVLAGSWGGITVMENGVCVNQIDAEQGLPHWQVHSVTFGPDGTLWAGTGLGVARYRTGDPEWTARNHGSDWSLRYSKRWLVNDDVRDVALDSHGNAWVATAGGVSAIKRRTMTLADKADHYMEILLARHVRDPWLVEKCLFPS